MARKRVKDVLFIKPILILSILGLLFSGYLTFTKIFSGVCAFNEPCPYFLGYPACIYGFGLYLLLFSFSLVLITNKVEYGPKFIMKTIGIISGIGVLFAGYMTFLEITSPAGILGSGYALILPTCVYGAIMYILILLLAILSLKGKRKILR